MSNYILLVCKLILIYIGHFNVTIHCKKMIFILLAHKWSKCATTLAVQATCALQDCAKPRWMIMFCPYILRTNAARSLQFWENIAYIFKS